MPQARDLLLQSLVEAQDGGVALIGPDHQILAVNAAWRDHVRQHCLSSCPACGKDAATADYLLDCVALHGPLASQAEVRLGMRAIVEGRLSEFVTEYSVAGNRWIRAQIRVLDAEQGFLVVLRDITDEWQAERDLENSELRYRSLFNSSQDAIFVIDAQRVLMVNPAGLRLLGLADESELLGRKPLDFIHPDFHDVTKSRFKRTLDAGQMNAPIEIKVVGPKGQWVEVESVSSPFDFGGQRAIHVLWRDLTRRRTAEAALKQHHELNERLLTTAQCIFLVLDPQGRILRVNPYMESICGYTNDELVGRDWFDQFLPAEVREATRALFLQAINDIETRGNVSPLIDRHGRQHMIEWYDKTIKDANGQTLGLLATGQDITERLAHDQHRQADAERLLTLSRHMVGIQEETRRRLAADLHDRASPSLAAIAINLEVAGLALQNRDWEEIGLRMSDNRALIQDTALNIREICTELRPPALDYGGLVPAIESYAAQFSRRTAIPVSITGTGPDFRLAPEVESILFRIYQEALTNIAKHSGTDRVSTGLAMQGDRLHLTIQDYGNGFAPHELGPESGLGLINMNEMAEFAGGVFTLVSFPGQGTTITVDIPVVEAGK